MRETILCKIVREELTKADGDLNSARGCVRQILLSNSDLLQSVLDEVIEAAIDNRVRERHRRDNAIILEQHSQEHGEVASRALLDLVLGSGIRLAAAVAPQLRDEEAFYHKQSRAMYTKAQFFGLVTERLPADTTTVEQILSEADLHGIFEQARTGEPARTEG